MAEWLSQRACAKELGCSPAYIQKLIKKKGLRTNSKKQVELGAARALICGGGSVHPRSQPVNQTSETETDSLTIERTRLAEVNRKLKEVELAEKRRELVRAEDVKLTWTNVLSIFRSRMAVLPDKVANKVANMTDPKECKRLVAAYVREALDELSSHDAGNVCRKPTGGDE